MKYLNIDFDNSDEEEYYYKKDKRSTKNKNLYVDYELNKKNNKQKYKNNKRMLDDFFN